MKNLKHYLTLICFVLLMLSISMSSHAQGQQREHLIGWWTFEPGVELVDLTGNFDDLTLKGAKVANGKLDVDSDSWAVTTEYSGPDFSEKTMVSWAILESLDVQGGSILTTQPVAPGQYHFDAIVFGERQPHRWCAGSGWFDRTQDFDPGFEEKDDGELIQMAISYEDDGGQTHITGYRNGEVIGEYTFGPIVLLEKGDTQVIFGTRWSSDGNPVDFVDALIEDARIYDEVLTQHEIKALQPNTTPVESRGKLATLWGAIKAK